MSEPTGHQMVRLCAGCGRDLPEPLPASMVCALGEDGVARLVCYLCRDCAPTDDD